MHAIQTLRLGGYKLALATMALTVAFTMSMAAHTSASGVGDFLNYNIYYNYNNADYMYYRDYQSGGNCYVRTELGTFWTAAYAKIKVINAGPTYCSVRAILQDSTGAWYYSAEYGANPYSYSAEAVVSGAAYTWVSRVTFVVQNGPDCNGQLFYLAYAPSQMVYNGHGHSCPV